MRPTTRTLKLTGPFTDADIAAFVALLRRIDQADPTGLYRIDLATPGSTMEDAEEMLAKLLPPLADRLTTTARAAYVDPRYPSRECDRCGRKYHGPAVYCSFECAVADA